ncbi:MAG TPA: tail fiber domain-containing protein [Verrucomicrobiae bacterium]|jgi:hypothetical protein
MKQPRQKPIIVTSVLLGLILAFNSEFSTAQAQNTIFTYQGQVLDSGAPFTGIGQFQFALVTSTNASQTATATANTPSGGYITSYNITFGGIGYVTAPAVTVIGGGGIGAAATAHLTGGSVTSITVANTGNGNYTNTPTVLIAPPPPEISYTTYWSNDGTSTNGSEPAVAVSVPVTNGLFTVILGDTTQFGMGSIPAALFSFQPNLQLRIWFNDNTHGFAAVNPAQNLTPAPYATSANTANNVDNGLTVQYNTNGAPNVVGGYQANFVSNNIYGATISGGGQANFSNSVTADFGTVGGGGGNIASGFASTVSGGDGNTASSPDGSATVGGGYANTASGDSSTVAGGSLNSAESYNATIGGGNDNAVNGFAATVGGGDGNTAGGDYGTVMGGENNYAGGEASVSGYFNTASGFCSTIPGGYDNTASGNYSFAAGTGAQALHIGSFVWSDALGESFASTAINQFAVRASGGILFAGDVQLAGGAEPYHNLSLSGGNATGYLYGSYQALGDGIHLGYNYYYDASGNGHISNAGGGTSRLSLQYDQIVMAVGGANTAPITNRLVASASGVTVYGTFNNSSDRNAKQDFAPVSSSHILEKVDQLPITEWSYKEDPTTRHVGPMGQDFYAAFNIGTDERHIAPIDEGGVALAAIKGLSQKMEAENAALRSENEDLKARLEKLEQLINSSKDNSK